MNYGRQRPGGDPDTLAELSDVAVARLRAAGCQVLMFTGFDPAGFPVIRLLRGDWLVARRADALWARAYLGPWVSRRLHGTSSGDGVLAKRPALRPVSPPIVM